MGRNTTNTVVLDACTQRIQALGRYVAPTDTILLGGQTLHVTDVVAIYQRSLDSRNSLTATRQALKVGLAARDSAEVTRKETDAALQAWVVSRFGAGSTQALAFGFTPPKPRTTSVATKAHATALAAATRKARHTMGSRQRAKITGTLPEDTTSTSASAVDAASTPAAAASPAAGSTPAVGTPPAASGTTTR